MFKRSIATISFCVSILGAAGSPAAASDWGCKVLLCAASDNPSWQSVPSCLPPMYKLIACKFKTFGACPWPTCPEGGAGKPGYAKYEECPSGWTPQASSSTGSGRSELDLCVQRRSDCSAHIKQGAGLQGLSCISSMPRPMRTKPYNFQITNSQTNQVETHWFSLKK
jgi:hypothetical protein